MADVSAPVARPTGAGWLRRRLRWLIVPVVLVPLTAVLFVGFGRDPSVFPSPLIGKPMPAFTLTALDGTVVSSADLAGKPLIVNFWASWCAPCRRELPRLDALNREMASQGASVVAVSIDQDAGNASRFAKSGRLSMPVACDGPGGLARQLDLRHVPATVVLDRDGRIAWSTGRSDDAELAKLAAVVRRLAGATPVAGAEPNGGGR